jgi:hypothetical protein
VNDRANALAQRLEQGAEAMIAFANTLTDAEWQKPLPHDGRKVGVVVHHVANMYPVEIELAGLLARGEPITGVTWDVVHGINAAHAKEHDGTTKDEAIALLRKNAADAAAAVRRFDDASLDRAAANSLYEDAPLTCQHMIEDHALRHSFHHLAGIRKAVGR